MASGARPPSRIRGQAPFQDLVPADDALSVFVGKTFHPPDHVALQRFHALQALGFHPGLAVRAAFPVSLAGFVSADVDILAGEQVKHLQEHLLEEFVGAFLAGTEFPLVGPVGLRQRAGQVRISGPGLVIVPGHLDFGNDVDVPLGRKGQDLGDILFGIVAAVSPRRSFFHEFSADFIDPSPRIRPGAARRSIASAAGRHRPAAASRDCRPDGNGNGSS